MRHLTDNYNSDTEIYHFKVFSGGKYDMEIIINAKFIVRIDKNLKSVYEWDEEIYDGLEDEIITQYVIYTSDEEILVIFINEYSKIFYRPNHFKDCVKNILREKGE